jgi:hypothetical protein
MLKMEAVCSPETLAHLHGATWRHKPEDHHRHIHCRENLRTHDEDTCYTELMMKILVTQNS